MSLDRRTYDVKPDPLAQMSRSKRSVSDFRAVVVVKDSLYSSTNTAVSRIQQIIEEPREESESDMTTSQDYKGLDWMTDSSISFNNAVLRYDPEGPPALRNLSLHIKSGERLGICGRTGSGKSSLLSALFRLYDIEEGSICVGGVDSKTIPRQALRDRMTLIPQEAMLLCCSLREVSECADRCPSF